MSKRFSLLNTFPTVSGQLCISLRGNISLCGNSVCTLVISLERIGTFLIKFCSSDQSFNRNILRSLYFKFRTSAHAQITISCYYVLMEYFWTWYEFKTYIGIHFDKWSCSKILSACIKFYQILSILSTYVLLLL